MTPKEQFLETPHAEAHRKLVQTEAFREALNYAMLECQRILMLDDPSDLFAATKQANRIAGAAVFRATLETLATVPVVPHGTKSTGLRHDAYDHPGR